MPGKLGFYVHNSGGTLRKVIEIRSDQTTQFADGAVGSPSWSFLNDTNTGIYRSASDTLVLVTGGVAALTVSSSQVVTLASDLKQSGGAYHYLRGDASTDGSVRMSSPSAGTFLLEARATGAWSTLFSSP
jgi:hypothetical protein